MVHLAHEQCLLYFQFAESYFLRGNVTMSKKQLKLVALENRETPSSSSIFDASWYLSHNPDVAAAVSQGRITPEGHFRKTGDAEGRSASPLFDRITYLADNSDVRIAVGSGTITAQRHFELYGQRENRNPSRAFSARDYLDDNSDVRAAVQAGGMTAFEHFLRYGMYEDRLPYRGFDRSTYLNDNPDVAQAVQAGRLTAVQHFELAGRHEGRRVASATPLAVSPTTPTVFTGVSQNHSDKKFYHFTPSQSGVLTVLVQSTNGVFAQAELEVAQTSVDVLETEPNNGINSASAPVMAGTTYLLRLRAPGDVAAAYSVRLTMG